MYYKYAYSTSTVHRIIVFIYMDYLQYTGMKLHGLKAEGRGEKTNQNALMHR